VIVTFSDARARDKIARALADPLPSPVTSLPDRQAARGRTPLSADLPEKNDPQNGDGRRGDGGRDGWIGRQRAPGVKMQGERARRISWRAGLRALPPPDTTEEESKLAS